MLGDRVTPAWITRLDLSSMMTNAKSGRKKRSVICKKSQAQICTARLRRKVAHFCPFGCGARTCLIYFWMVRLHTCMPSFRSYCQKYHNLAKTGRYASEEGNGEDMRHMLILVPKRNAIAFGDGVPFIIASQVIIQRDGTRQQSGQAGAARPPEP